MGDHLYRASKYEEAYDSYQRAAKLNPDLGDDLYFKLGNISYKKKDLEGAKGFWQRVIELNPGHELARSNLEMLESVS
jgi:tetratricopeptide (TPR) repeat protein